MTSSLTARLPCRSEAPREARRAVERFDFLPTRAYDALRLVVTELVGNSARHSGLGKDDFIDVAIRSEGTVLRIDVHDAGRGFVRAVSRDRGGGGVGLAMVQGLTCRFGIIRDNVTAAGTHAWAEIDTTDGEAEPAAVGS